MQLPRLLYPERVAAATIRGYVTQAHYSVLRWLGLGANEAIICEGDEDIDRYLLDSSGAVVSIQQEQIKDLAGRISARDAVAHESIFNFLRSFQAHDAGGTRCTFVFTTTATLKDQQTVPSDGATTSGARLLIDVLRNWSKLDASSGQQAVDGLRDAIHELAREYGPLPSTKAKTQEAQEQAAAIERALAYLDGEPTRWRRFLEAVTWQTAQPDLPTVTAQIESVLQFDARTKHLPSALLLPRLLAAVLGASVRADAAGRVLVASDLEAITKLTDQDLEAWARAHPRLAATALVTVVARLDDIEQRVVMLERANDPVEKLKNLSRRAVRELKTHTTITFRDAQVTVVRDDVNEIASMAAEGHLVVVGEPGAGKSAVLYGLATHLEEDGDLVVVLNADDLPDLDVGTTLSEALQRWPGSTPGYLIIDALDSPRDETAARRMQQALGEVIELRGRWRVIASSRTFDLRARASMAELFEGKPHASRNEPGLSLVRNFKVGSLTDAELAQLGVAAPELASLLEAAPPRLRALLRIPFNLSLAAKLLEAGASPSEIQTIRTQLDLLDRYWTRRVGDPAARRYVREAAVRSIAAEMIRSRRLRVGVEVAVEPSSLPELLSAQVLVNPQWTDAGQPDERLLAFSHRVLFDYAVSATYLPALASDLRQRVVEQPDLVLLSLSGLEMYFQRAWGIDGSRARFWSAAMEIAGEPDVREITKVVAPAVAARAAISVGDFDAVLTALRSSDDRQRGAAEGVLRHVVGALLAAPRSEIPLSGTNGGPWAELTHELSRIGSRAAIDSAWRLLSVICEEPTTLTPTQRAAAGSAARDVLTWCRTNAVTPWLLGLAAELVCRTFRSDPAASAALLRELIEPEALQQHGHVTLFRIANALSEVLAADTRLVADVFAAAFRVRDESQVQTDIGGGPVLPLASNRRQDYEGGLYALQQEFPKLLKADLVSATRSLVSIVEAYVDREHEVENPQVSSFTVGGADTRMVTDHSSIWDSGPHDKELEMLGEWEQQLGDAVSRGSPDSDEAVQVVVASQGYAVLWRSLLRVAARVPVAGQRFKELLFCRPILTGRDTSGLAGDFLSAVFPELGDEDRRRIELAILAIAEEPAKQRAVRTRDRLLGCTGDPSLLMTEEARKQLMALQAADAVPPNERPVRLQRMHARDEESEEVRLEREGIELDRPENRRVFDLSERLKALDALPENVVPAAEVLRDSSKAVADLDEALRVASVSAALRAEALDRLAAASDRIAAWGPPDADAVRTIRRTLLAATKCTSPEPYVDHASFDELPSWGYPAARISAASGLCALAFGEEAIDAETHDAIERMSTDPAPAVRFQVAQRVACLNRDPVRMWRVIEQMAAADESRGVLTALVHGLSDVAAMDLARTSRNLSTLLSRGRTGPGAKRLRESATALLAALYMDRDEANARSAILAIATDPAAEDAEPLPAMTRSRLGRPSDADANSGAIRARAWSLLSGLADAAAPMFLSLEQRLRSGERVSEEERARAQAVAKLLDAIGRVVYFGSGAHDAKKSADQRKDTPDPDLYYRDCSALVDRLASVGMPGLAHNLIQVLEYLAPVDPAGVFLQVARVVSSSEKSGYQYDGLAVKLLVQLVSRYLADHRALLRDDETLRRALLDVLDTFVRAGWPEARNLTYELHVIFQ